MPRSQRARMLMTSVAAAILLLATGCAGPRDTTPTGTATPAEEEGVPTNFLELRVGDCFDIPTNLPSGEALAYSSCDVLHMYEAFDETELPAGEFPGSSKVDEAALAFCEPAFREFMGESWTTSDFDFQYIVPSERTWNESDDRRVMCMVTALDGLPRSGSAQHGGR